MRDGIGMTGILLAFGALACRLAGVVNVRSVPSDTYAHMYFAKELKAQRAGPFGMINTKYDFF